ncbi:uncharacterized protein LOC111608819 isoform X1 [Xiphophorus maculatus]|uniref:uncharacterized protein LOC111608819 isoform X1 n=1 Tax=Xiphophorus maculatus TaxID=8083 RepID=UPI000C6CA6FA|nr:uncharacterized protein LOC111608819 isoform X1 [Xiphophorus maculatus]XP_023190799.1 uncharacterized protein LOC111608819 isoform X1 [Xiphophorus maculatus]
MKKTIFYPGRRSVVFRKGPLGFLLQDPSPEAKKIKNNPSLWDKSEPKREDVVRQNALTVVLERGGDVTDVSEVLGDYSLQFGKYKGKCFRWLLENGAGYTLYLIRNLQKEEEAGICITESLSKVNLLTFVKYALSFKEIKDALDYEASKITAASSEDDQLVGFGSRAKSTWKEIWDGREDGYADFILKKSCLHGTRMQKLQQYLLKKQQSSSSQTNTPSGEPDKCLVMEEDEGLEAAMLNISPSKILSSKQTMVSIADILTYVLLALSFSHTFVSVYTVSGSADTERTPVSKASSRAKTGFPSNRRFQNWSVIL